LHALVAGHPFVDGNKRAGLAATLLFLELNGISTDVPTERLYQLTMDVANGVLREIDLIAASIEGIFGPEDA
jgi:death-on-curing protein